MKKEIIINASKDRSRIAIVEDGELVELYVENPENVRTIGNIYLGEVQKVMPAIRAGFVDIGEKQDAFLHFSDLTDNAAQLFAMAGEDVPGLDAPILSRAPQKRVADDENEPDVEETLEVESGSDDDSPSRRSRRGRGRGRGRGRSGGGRRREEEEEEEESRPRRGMVIDLSSGGSAKPAAKKPSARKPAPRDDADAKADGGSRKSSDDGAETDSSNGADTSDAKPSSRRRGGSRDAAESEQTSDAKTDASFETPSETSEAGAPRPRRRSRSRSRDTETTPSETTDDAPRSRSRKTEATPTEKAADAPRSRSRKTEATPTEKAADAPRSRSRKTNDTSDNDTPDNDTPDREAPQAGSAAAALDALFEEDAPRKKDRKKKDSEKDPKSESGRSRRSTRSQTADTTADEADAPTAESDDDTSDSDGKNTDESSDRSSRRGRRGGRGRGRSQSDDDSSDDTPTARRSRDDDDSPKDDSADGEPPRSRRRSRSDKNDPGPDDAPAASDESQDEPKKADTPKRRKRRKRTVAVVDLTGGGKPSAKSDADSGDAEDDTPGRSRSRTRQRDEDADDASRGRGHARQDDDKDADNDEDSGRGRRRARGRNRSDDDRSDDAGDNSDDGSDDSGRGRRRSRSDADQTSDDSDSGRGRNRSRKDSDDADAQDDSSDSRRSRGRGRSKNDDDDSDRSSDRGGRSRKTDDDSDGGDDDRSSGRSNGRSSRGSDRDSSRDSSRESGRDSGRGRGNGRDGGRSSGTRTSGPVPPAHELMRRGTRVLCKVTKEPISSKGSRVSTDISLAGRFLVLVPAADYIAVSKKIESSKERRRLKSLAQSLKPDDCGVIVRTVAEGRDAKSLDLDLRLLIEKWDDIKSKLVGRPNPPVTLYEDVNMVSSIIRDLFSEDFDRILIDDPKVFKNVQAYVRAVAPDMVDNVQLHNSSTPVYRAAGLEKQVEEAFSRRVNMKGGGYLFIETTEAMHVVDVNSGRAGRGKSQKDNLMAVNLEAAREVAKQLRLRDLGGIIVVDFIDLRHESDRRRVTDELKKAFQRDRAVTKLLPMSDFGLVQITRQRLRPSITATTTDEDGQPLDAADAIAAAGAGEIAQPAGRTYQEPEAQPQDSSRQDSRPDDARQDATPQAATPAELAGRIRGWLDAYRAQVDDRYRGRPIIVRVHPLLGAFLRRGFPSTLTRWRFAVRGISYRVDEDPTIDPLGFDVRDEKSGRSLLSKYTA